MAENPPKEKSDLDKLTGQLNNLPELIGRLGLGVAAAQRALNADYVESLGKIVGFATYIASLDQPEIERARKALEAAQKKATDTTATDAQRKAAQDEEKQAREALDKALAPDKQKASERFGLVSELIKSLAPSKYQFTETTLEFSADLSQSMDLAFSASIGVNLPVVSVNASLALGFGYDYRAAARVTTKLHAIPGDTSTLNTLLNRAATIDREQLQLPTIHQGDATVWNNLGKIYNSLGKEGDPKAVTTFKGGEPPLATGAAKTS